MSAINFINKNLFIISAFIFGVFLAIKYFIIPWMKTKTHLPKNFDPFKNLEQYENVKNKNEKKSGDVTDKEF